MARSRTATAPSCCSIRGRRRPARALPGAHRAGCATARRASSYGWTRSRRMTRRRPRRRRRQLEDRCRPRRRGWPACWRPSAARRARTRRSGSTPGWSGCVDGSSEATPGLGAGAPRPAPTSASTASPAPTTPARHPAADARASRRAASRDRPRPATTRSRRSAPGTDRGWGVVVICGARGQRGRRRARRPDARDSMRSGDISGDWGGGTDVGVAGLGGRRPGPRRPRPADRPRADGARPFRRRRARWHVTMAFYDGRDPAAADRRARAGRLRGGERRATSSAARSSTGWPTSSWRWPAAMLRRLHLTRLDPEVVLGGGVFRTPDAAFYAADRSRRPGDRAAATARPCGRAAGRGRGAPRPRCVARCGRGRRDRGEGPQGARGVGR